jgi:hypothetical protein
MTNATQPEEVFTLTIDAQQMNVHFRPGYIGGLDPYALIEFTSPYEPRRRIPVSETGYRSYFAPMHEIEAAPSVEEYTRMVALALIAQESVLPAEDLDQLPLL